MHYQPLNVHIFLIIVRMNIFNSKTNKASAAKFCDNVTYNCTYLLKVCQAPSHSRKSYCKRSFKVGTRFLLITIHMISGNLLKV